MIPLLYLPGNFLNPISFHKNYSKTQQRNLKSAMLWVCTRHWRKSSLLLPPRTLVTSTAMPYPRTWWNGSRRYWYNSVITVLSILIYIIKYIDIYIIIQYNDKYTLQWGLSLCKWGEPIRHLMNGCSRWTGARLRGVTPIL